jgi:hypothetical protein
VASLGVRSLGLGVIVARIVTTSSPSAMIFFTSVPVMICASSATDCMNASALSNSSSGPLKWRSSASSERAV